MKLNREQIAELYSFTRQHYVVHYDLQTELVDHLANAIESSQEQTPGLRFDEALNIEFKKFGVFGFMDVVEKRQTALNRKYHKLVWTLLMKFFRLPRILLTVFAIFVLYKVLGNLVYSEEIYMLTFGIIIILNLMTVAWYGRNKKKSDAHNQKRWLYKDIIYGYGSFASFGVLPFQILSHFYRRTSLFNSNWELLAMCMILVAFALFSYIILFLIPSQAEVYLKQTYPEYELVEL